MPEKFAVDLPLEKIVCDENVDSEYARSLAEVDVSKFKPIVVIKHPKEGDIRGPRWTPSPRGRETQGA